VGVCTDVFTKNLGGSPFEKCVEVFCGEHDDMKSTKTVQFKGGGYQRSQVGVNVTTDI